ncbi:uncharacterized protein LOC106011603 [Aplysia californica]|uniref:Uncharacterized protein LOC106011603 n=1 Tax=Aplysia californica TaxID=6500 RepID=A0ABM0ZYN2_APLCA|nr:uncharacterized protein LOC106011603 [Aplysia californica]
MPQRPPHPNQRPPHPNQRPPHPNQRPPQMPQRPPHPNQRPPHPNQRPPQMPQRPPHPNQRPPQPAPTTPKPAPTTPKPAPTTPKPAPTTATPGPTTTTPKPTTTTPKPTTTTTTPAPTTTTPLKCPDLPPSLSLTIEADVNGNAELICAMPSAPVNNIQVEFTWQIEGVSEKWTRVIEAPDVQARLPVSELDINLFNKRIVCKAQLSWMVPGAPDCPHYKISQVLIPTLTVTTTSQLVVIEGREPEVVQVRPTCPPSALCKPEDNGRCTVQITTVITTQRREIRCSRREIKPQAVLGVTDIKTGSSSSVCGVEVTKDNWQKPVTIPVKATIDKVIDRDQTRVIQVSIRVTGKITGTTETHEIGKVPVKAIDRDRRAQCSSVNDPHMKTFDGVRYNNFVPGEFVLFKHKTLPYEVRSRYQLCSSRRPTGATCNCGAAVRSGDDVIVFDACNRNSRRVTVIDVQMYKNGQLTPGTSIRKHGCGQKYEVFLPTGMKVTISRSRQPFINIYVTPSSPDFERSEGLCGNYNGNARDDLEGERSRAPTKWNMKWKRSDTYFRGVAAYPYPSPPVYCSCQSNQSPVCKAGLDVYMCTTRRISGLDITSILIRGARRPSLSNGRNTQRRHKRAVEDDPADVEEEEDMPTMTPEEAVQNCSDYLNASPLLGKCSSYIDSNATAESIRECAEDLEALGDPTWARSHLDHMLEECMENVQLEQEEEEEENNSTTTTPSPAQSLIQNLCVDDCGDHGDCVAGVCDCKDGWTGQTCDVSAKTRPEVYPAEEICDSVTSSCSDVKIDGNNFVQSPNLSCTFRYDDTPEKKRGEADLVSMYQVICREPESELKGRKARITISNDGEEESEESYLRVVYKSSCESCQLDSDGSKKCTPKTDICIIGGECYARNQVSEKDGCYFCNPDVSTSQWDRSSDPGCGPTVCPPPEATAQPVQAGNSDSDTDTVIIVLGVLCGVMSLVAMAATYTACKGRRKPQQKHVQLEEQSPKFDIHRRNVTDPTRHTYGNNAYDNDDNVEK